VSKLTDFLHELVDRVGVSSLHDAVDELDTPADETGEGETSNAAE
jgi:hypothetical protein